ncbi:MAG: NfeD family protein [bacterium]
MEITIVVIFMLLGIAFFILEIFFLPGISIGGVAGTIFVGAAVWYAFEYLGAFAGWLTLFLGTIALVLAIVVFLKSKTLERISLSAELEDVDRPFESNELAVGDRGVTISRMATSGVILINDKELEAKSVEGYIDPNTPIEISEIDGVNIYVKQIK